MPFPARFVTKVGSLGMPTFDSTVAYTGVGFKPKALILLSAGNDTAGAWQGAGTAGGLLGLAMAVFTETEARDGVGGSGDPARRGGVIFESSRDNASSILISGADNNCGIYQRIWRVQDCNEITVGQAALVSMDADGFTLQWSSVLGDYVPIIGYLALGGEALLAKVVKWTMPQEEGTLERVVTRVGFRPEAVLHLFSSSEFSPTPWLDTAYTDPVQTSFRVGAMDAAGHEWAIGYARADGLPTNSKRHIKVDRCMYGTEYNSAGPDYGPPIECELIGMTEDGFHLRCYQSHRATVVVSLALGGIQARVGTITKPTATGSQATTGVGFNPSALLLASTMQAAAGETDGIRASIGFAASSSSRFAVGRTSNDNVDPSVEQQRTELAKVHYGVPAEVTHADLTSFDADGWTLAWTTSFAAEYLVPYLALGAPLSPVHLFELELNGVAGGWTDITADVLLHSPGASLRWGIGGTGPLDLTASTGTLSFALNNNEKNSAGLTGYYSPRHPNCRPGFRKGIRVRYTYLIPSTSDGYGKFVGRLRDIEPEPGKYRDRKTMCMAADWMNEAAITKFSAATQVAKRVDQILPVVLALVPRQPDSTLFDTGDSTFPYALDNAPTERSTVLTELQRLAQSEYGRIYLRGGLNYWGRLRFEKRTARLTPLPLAVFAGTMQELEAGDSSGKVKNKAKVTVHPRRVDAAATTVLFSKPNQNNPSVGPLATLRMTGKYVDPSNPNARVGGTDMVAPVATTDYLMNAAADGSGSNLTANFTVVATYGANQVVYAITNNSAVTAGFITKLQARGRGLYDYDPLEAEVENADSIADIGESLVELAMVYQGDLNVGLALAQYLVDTWSSHELTAGTEPSSNTTPGVTEIGITCIPRSSAELTALMALEIGDPITAAEELAVVNDVYYIQGAGLKITGDKSTFDFTLQRALVQSYWTLGTAGLSELGNTTVLAPL